jgi:hypothetical protein
MPFIELESRPDKASGKAEPLVDELIAEECWPVFAPAPPRPLRLSEQMAVQHRGVDLVGGGRESFLVARMRVGAPTRFASADALGSHLS